MARWLGLAVLVLGSFLGWRAAILFFGGAREIIPGKVFRSRQLSGAELENALDRFGIRSVLNLRGHGHGRTWYSEEQAICRQMQVTHATVTFDVDEWPPRQASLRFLKMLEELEQPVLMHCHRGVDRTGWAGAVVVLANGGTVKEGEAQLSSRLGHVCLQSSCPQHKFFASYRRWLSETDRKQSAAVFRRWLSDIYCPDPWNAELSIVGDVPNEAPAGSEIELMVQSFNNGNQAWLMGPSGVRVGIRVLGPLESIPADPVAPFLDRDSPTIDLGRGEASIDRMGADQSEVFQINANLPKKPGLYLLQIDMVKEHVHWFSEMGWPGIVWPLEIVEK